MYLASTKYLTHIDTSIVRTPCSKVVIDGVEYSGRTHLKIYPKISHATPKMIGGFSAATCEFEIYNLDGNLNLNGKEVEVYRGLEINGAASWIPMGMFSATDDNITNNKTARSITFKGYDRATLFDVAFVKGEDITFPCTLLEFVKKLCVRRGVSLEKTDFPMAELVIETAPNIPSNYTERQLISCAAELGGCIARINRLGNLEISKPYPTGRRISRTRYSAVSIEPAFGPINSVVLGREGYSDDIVYPVTAPDNLCEWRIEDNPFVENRREELIADIAANIIGMSFIPFKITDCVEDYILDINDSIEIASKDGTVFTATVLSKTTSSRIRSELKAETQNNSVTNRKIAGSMKDAIKRVQLDVDHQNNRINALVEDSVSRAEIEMLSEEINIRFDTFEKPDTVESVTNAVTTISKDGVSIKNGALTLTDDDGNVLIGVNTDENGDMYVSGNIRANSLEADSVDAEAIQSGAITSDKLAVGIAKRSNLFYNHDFAQTYKNASGVIKAMSWIENDGTITPQSGWCTFKPKSTSASGFTQRVWLTKGRYSLILRMQFYNLSSVSSPYLRLKLGTTTVDATGQLINAGTGGTNIENKETIFKFVFDYTSADAFVDVGVVFKGFSFSSSGYVSVTWTALVRSDEEPTLGFFCSNSYWLSDSKRTITYHSNLEDNLNDISPFQVDESGRLEVVDTQIGGFKITEQLFYGESNVVLESEGVVTDGYKGGLEIVIPHGTINIDELEESEIVSKAFRGVFPTIKLVSYETSAHTTIGMGSIELSSIGTTYIDDGMVNTTDVNATNVTAENFYGGTVYCPKVDTDLLVADSASFAIGSNSLELSETGAKTSSNLFTGFTHTRMTKDYKSFFGLVKLGVGSLSNKPTACIEASDADGICARLDVVDEERIENESGNDIALASIVVQGKNPKGVSPRLTFTADDLWYGDISIIGSLADNAINISNNAINISNNAVNISALSTDVSTLKTNVSNLTNALNTKLPYKVRAGKVTAVDGTRNVTLSGFSNPPVVICTPLQSNAPGYVVTANVKTVSATSFTIATDNASDVMWLAIGT